MLKLLMNLSSVLALVAGLIYSVVFFRFHATLKKNQALWEAFGRPDVFNHNGQAKIIGLIFQLSKRDLGDRKLQRQALILRGLLLTALASFIVLIVLAVTLNKAS